jgi:uncharacterized protein (DUF362 family)
MKRRTFLKASAVSLAAAALALEKTKAASGPPSFKESGRSGPEATVCLAGVARGSTERVFKNAVREAAEASTDFSWLSKGDTVFIKPALNSGNRYPATTSPAAIGAMVALLMEKGAGRVIVGDMSGIEHVKLTPQGVRGSSRELMKNCGMAEAAVRA